MEKDPKECGRNLAASPEFDSVKRSLALWLPTTWAQSAPTKKEYSFDPETFTWIHRKSGRVTKGKVETTKGILNKDIYCLISAMQ